MNTDLPIKKHRYWKSAEEAYVRANAMRKRCRASQTMRKSCYRSLLLLAILWLDEALSESSTFDNDNGLYCMLTLHSMLHSAMVASSRDIVYCQPVVSGTVAPYSYNFPADNRLDEILSTATPLLRRGEELYMSIPSGAIEQGRVMISDQAQPTLLKKLPFNDSLIQRRRQLSSAPATMGALTAIMIRIVALDAEPTPTRDELHYYLWDSQVSLQSQMLACSAGKLLIVPTSYGVMDVYVNLDATGSNYMDLVNAAYDAALISVQAAAASYSTQAAMSSATATDNVAAITDIRELADLIMFVVPPGTISWENPTEPQYDWVAFGAIPGKQSVYNDIGATIGPLCHEIGHNLGLMHAWDSEIDYGDVTGYMGAAVKRVEYPRRCYNAQNHAHLGWYDDRLLSINDTSIPTLHTVAAFVDYKLLTNASHLVVLEIPSLSLYLQYNRAKDFNVETGEYLDHLTVVQDFSTGTNLVAALNETTPLFEIDQGNGHMLIIQVCSTHTGVEGLAPDTMTVSIGMDKSMCSPLTSNKVDGPAIDFDFRSRRLPQHFVTLLLAVVFVLVSFTVLYRSWHAKPSSKNDGPTTKSPSTQEKTTQKQGIRRNQSFPRTIVVRSLEVTADQTFRSSDESSCSFSSASTNDGQMDPFDCFGPAFYDLEMPTIPSLRVGHLS